jgi:hypothetical protein
MGGGRPAGDGAQTAFLLEQLEPAALEVAPSLAGLGRLPHSWLRMLQLLLLLLVMLLDEDVQLALQQVHLALGQLGLALPKPLLHQLLLALLVVQHRLQTLKLLMYKTHESEGSLLNSSKDLLCTFSLCLMEVSISLISIFQSSCIV